MGNLKSSNRRVCLTGYVWMAYFSSKRCKWKNPVNLYESIYKSTYNLVSLNLSLVTSTIFRSVYSNFFLLVYVKSEANILYGYIKRRYEFGFRGYWWRLNTLLYNYMWLLYYKMNNIKVVYMPATLALKRVIFVLVIVVYTQMT